MSNVFLFSFRKNICLSCITKVANMVTAVYEQQISPTECDNGVWTDIHVKNPALTSGKYTTYAIVLDTNDPSFSLKHSVVRRRYSDFVRLREILLKQHSCVKPPHLPGKSVFKNRFADAFIEKRREGLQKFLNKVCLVPIYLSNKAVHLFLQSTFSMDEIKAIIKGNSLDYSIAVDYILNKNANTRVQEVNSVGYEEFSKYDSLIPFEAVSGEENKEAGSTSTSSEVAVSAASSKYSLQPTVLSSAPKKVSFSDTVVVASIHT